MSERGGGGDDVAEDVVTDANGPVATHHESIRVGLSTSSMYPENCAASFEAAARLGYDGIEVMVWNDPVSQDPEAVRALSEVHGVPVLSIHAPTLLLTQRVWGPDPWTKVDRSIELAQEVGAHTVVLHPPFRWQHPYAEEFVDGVGVRQQASGITVAVENMFPWRARTREMQAYLPGWDPVDLGYDSVTLDLSHTATAGSDAMAMARALGERLAHVHLADGLGSPRDEHLVPGRGTQPCGELLEWVANRDNGFAGDVIVEVNTRKVSPREREGDLAEALAFARLHLFA